MDKVEKIEALKLRTKQLSLRVVKLFQALPKTEEARIMGKQLLRSATSVAANYRAACRARSHRQSFLAKYLLLLRRLTKHYFGWSY